MVTAAGSVMVPWTDELTHTQTESHTTVKLIQQRVHWSEKRTVHQPAYQGTDNSCAAKSDKFVTARDGTRAHLMPENNTRRHKEQTEVFQCNFGLGWKKHAYATNVLTSHALEIQVVKNLKTVLKNRTITVHFEKNIDLRHN